jgi:hypothetical protein
MFKCVSLYKLVPFTQNMFVLQSSDEKAIIRYQEHLSQYEWEIGSS